MSFNIKRHIYTSVISWCVVRSLHQGVRFFFLTCMRGWLVGCQYKDQVFKKVFVPQTAVCCNFFVIFLWRGKTKSGKTRIASNWIKKTSKDDNFAFFSIAVWGVTYVMRDSVETQTDQYRVYNATTCDKGENPTKIQQINTSQ